MTTLTFTIPREYWLTSNMRLHWAKKARRVKALRTMGFIEGRKSRLKYDKPVHIVAWIGYASATKADPINASEAGKPLIDGLVQAGVFPDDSHEWIEGPDYRRDPIKAPRGTHTVRLEITERSAE